MVKYKLFFKETNILKYYYYVEGHFDTEPGIIEVNLEKGSIEIITPAPDDYLNTFTVEDALLIRKGLNELRKNSGEPELTEDELEPPKKDVQYYIYGSHAMNGIRERINEDNQTPENGTVAWY